MDENLKNLDGCITTFSGLKFSLVNPDPNQVNINDIAKGLAYKGHFGGQTPQYFSVAQHTTLALHFMENDDMLSKDPELMLVALLHDASEAYLCDMLKPIKVMLPEFIKYENRMTEAIFKAYNISSNRIKEMKPYDMLAQKFEYEQFFQGFNHFEYESPDESLANFMNWHDRIQSKL